MTIADSTAGTLFGTSGASQAGFGRASNYSRRDGYAEIATPGGDEARLEISASGVPWLVQQVCFRSPASDVADWNSLTIPSRGVPDRGAMRRGESGNYLWHPIRQRRTGHRPRGPANLNFDVSILKTTTIRENHMLQFRAEFFNAFNHPQFTNPNFGQGAIYGLPNFAAGNFGQITSTSVRSAYYSVSAVKYIS